MTLAELGEQLRSKDTTATQLLTAAQERADSCAKLNAFITRSDEQATEQAQRAQERIDNGDAGPLCGIPIAFKDIFCTLGTPTSCGSKLLEGFLSPYESHVTDKLGAAGTVSIGKCNMDEFAMGSTGENSAFGPTHNPWNHAHSCGGSSSGSAVAVAAGIVPVAIGTDTGGSVRMPAAYCGISGIKPTYGNVSRRGMVAYSSSMDQAGVFATCAADLRTTLLHMAGHDPFDATSYPDNEMILESITQRKELSELRIGVAEEFFSTGVDNQVAATVRETLTQLEELGATIVPVKFPHLGQAVSAYYIIACAEASSNLARFDGLLYGNRVTAETLDETIKQSRSQGFGAEVQKRIMLGAYCLSHGYVDEYYNQANKVRQLLKHDFQAVFNQCDLIATPTTPTTAPKLGAFAEDPELMYSQDVCTVTANMCQLPALSIPCGMVDELPVGIQLLGPRHSDGLLLSAAEGFQAATEHHTLVPPTSAA